MRARLAHRSICTVGGILLGAGAFALLAVTSCAGEPEVPETPYPDAGTTTTTTTPTVVDAGPTVQTGPCDAVMSMALQAAIKGREKDELARGMKPEGALACAHLAEGGSTAVKLMLQQGKCYTFVAESYPDVTELDLKMTLDMGDNVPPLFAPLAAQPMAVDTDTGPRATIGRKESCYPYNFMIPAAVKVEATARSGAGPVAVQAYSR